MLVVEFFTWWYAQGWHGVFVQAGKRLRAVIDAFSISTLLRTLFAPWRRIISYAGAGLDAHIRAAIDNSVSRFIGFLIRLVALLAACMMLILTSIFSLFCIVLWPLLPVLAIGLIVWGLV